MPLQQDHVKEISNNHNFDLSTAMPMFGESVRLVKVKICCGLVFGHIHRHDIKYIADNASFKVQLECSKDNV